MSQRIPRQAGRVAQADRYAGAVTFRFPGAAAGVNVLSITPFRRLWIATSLSSLGDWLSLLALTALALTLAETGGGRRAPPSAVCG